jgi:hypothetical protein
MPKDLIHFKVAMQTADRLADTRFGPPLSRNTPGLLLGAVFHDVLFYGVTKAGRPLAALADRLHGANGQDTYGLVRIQAGHAAVCDDQDLASALLVGMVSHLFADAAMHPLVWHLSGHYYANKPEEKTLARQHHRALESLMDMLFCPEMLGRPLFLIRHLLRTTGPGLLDALPMDKLADLAGISAGKARKGLRSAFRIHAGFQAAYPVKILARLLFALMPILPDAAREIAALFYAPQLMIQADRLRGEVNFRHPVTGKAASRAIPDMMNQAADKAADLCRRLERTVYEGEKPDLPESGPSMDAGLSGTSADAMRYFADPSFPKLP